MPHKSLEIIARFDIVTATQIILKMLYRGIPVPTTPKTNATLQKTQRNEEIRKRHAAGESYNELSRVFGISAGRVQQIVKHRRK